MDNLYNRIESLCDDRGINITEMCRESGASRGSLTDLKMGRKKLLNADTLAKIANYFGVSVDYLLGNSSDSNTVQKIIELLEEKGVSAAKMSRDLGFSNAIFYQWKKGLQKPSAEKIAKMADYFGVSTDYLLGNEEKKEAPALNDEDRRDIAARLKELRDDLTKADGLMFDGMKLNEQTLDFLMSSLERDITTATLLAKQRDQKENKKD